MMKKTHAGLHGCMQDIRPDAATTRATAPPMGRAVAFRAIGDRQAIIVKRWPMFSTGGKQQQTSGGHHNPEGVTRHHPLPPICIFETSTS